MLIRSVNGVLRFVHFAKTNVLLLGVLLLGVLVGLQIWHQYKIQAIRRASGRVQNALVEMESSQRGYLLLPPWGKIGPGSAPASPVAAPYLDKYELYRRLLAMRLLELCQVIPANQANEMLCRSINTMVKEKVGEMDTTIALRKQGRGSAALAVFATGTGQQLETEIERTIDQIRLTDGHYHSMEACLVLIH